VKFHLDDLRKRGYNPLILYDRARFYRSINRSPYFQSPQKNNFNLSSESFIPEGSYDDAVLINLRGTIYDVIIIVDLKRYAKLVQYPYRSCGDFPLDIKIKSIDEKEADRLIELETHNSIDNQIRESVEIEQKRRNLQQRLVLEICERCQFEDIDTNSGILIRLKSDED
jgi:hypothetical protein